MAEEVPRGAGDGGFPRIVAEAALALQQRVCGGCFLLVELYGGLVVREYLRVALRAAELGELVVELCAAR